MKEERQRIFVQKFWVSIQNEMAAASGQDNNPTGPLERKTILMNLSDLCSFISESSIK